MKKFIAVVLLVAVFATLGLTACGSKNDNTATTTAPQGTSGETKATVKTAKDGVLTMVTNAEFPPYEYYDGDKIVGIDAEVAQLIAENSDLLLKSWTATSTRSFPVFRVINTIWVWRVLPLTKTV